MTCKDADAWFFRIKHVSELTSSSSSSKLSSISSFLGVRGSSHPPMERVCLRDVRSGFLLDSPPAAPERGGRCWWGWLILIFRSLLKVDKEKHFVPSLFNGDLLKCQVGSLTFCLFPHIHHYQLKVFPSSFTYRASLLCRLFACLFFHQPSNSWHLLQVCHQLSQLSEYSK